MTWIPSELEVVGKKILSQNANLDVTITSWESHVEMGTSLMPEMEIVMPVATQTTPTNWLLAVVVVIRASLHHVWVFMNVFKRHVT